MKFRAAIFGFLGLLSIASAQTTAPAWQQRVEYTMDIDFDATKHQFKGKQRLVYYNNSPDTLSRAYYHLYFNAFQPGSAMDVRSRTIADPDGRVRDRISKLSPAEIGYQKILKLTQDGKEVQHRTEGTILEVALATPILPNKKTVFEMEFEGQVPIQIRRSGRNNAEGVDYSMAQWYPKLCEYDHMGWHPNPYVGREFHGVWGDFEVKITIDKKYVVAGTGILQNPQEIGYGYEDKSKPLKNSKNSRLTWHFKAPQVHDFVWAADPDFVQDIAQVPDGPKVRFFYQNIRPETVKNWKAMQEPVVKAFQFMNKTFGKYPYPEYAIIQGGDGGMEYPMATLIVGDRPLGSIQGTAIHELIHSWFQGVLATNESLYAWMDEGFNSFAGNELEGNDHQSSYEYYYRTIERGIEEPLSLHADHFQTNAAYTMAAYGKGDVFLYQLGYIIGKDQLMKGMLSYYNTWKFRHPTPWDLQKIMERQSGMVLDWYWEYLINTTYTVDYGIKNVEIQADKALVTLERVGRIPMPIEVVVTFADGSQELYYIPLDLMRGEKANETKLTRTTLADWTWTVPSYAFEIQTKGRELKSLAIDPSKRLADAKPANNTYTK